MPLAAWLTLTLGLVVAIFLFLTLRDLEHKAQTTDFRQQANLHALRLEQGLAEAVNAVVILNQLFVVNETVSREQFRLFTQPLLQRHPYIQAFNFHRIVDASERAAYEAGMRPQFPGFAMTEMSEGKPVPVRPRERHIVVDYLEPMKGNEAALGLDVSAHGHLLETMRQAADTGAPGASDLLQLAQGEGGARLGFEVLIPVYRKGAVLTDVQSRRDAWIGDVAVIFSVQKLIEKALGNDGLLTRDNPEIRVYAAGSADETRLAFRSTQVAAAKAKREGWPDWILPRAINPVAHDFLIAGRPWHMVMVPSTQPALLGQYASFYILIGGILFSLLAAAYIHALEKGIAR